MGITEQTDAIAVVVSEETGQISLCADGEIHQALSPAIFRERLAHLLKDRRTRDSESREREALAERSASERIEA
jgi:diadenylate cyclase